MSLLIEENAVVLFQGDSITDAGRNREVEGSLGGGYANMAGAWFQAKYPFMNVRFINRGMGGHRVRDLQGRWDEDCINLQPTWVSIMIGINDTWMCYGANDPTSHEEFEASYRDILTRTKRQTKAKIILIEQFVLPIPEDRIQWRGDLGPKIDIVRKLAREFADAFVPMDGIFANAMVHRPPVFWAMDGIHPLDAGHALIARSWLQAVGAI